MKRVLVTGASGFIGRYSLARLRDMGFEVHAVSRRKKSEADAKGFWHQADLLDPSQMAKLIKEVAPNNLLHFAWFAEPGEYWESGENFRWAKASLDLLEAFRSSGGDRVVMAGTSAEYDWSGDGYCSESETPLNPNTTYGKCKRDLQRQVEKFCLQEGLSYAWGRIFFLYGPYEHPKRLISYVIQSLIKGEPALCSSGSQARDFLYVEDVASAFIGLLDSEVQGPVNIGSGQAIAVKEVVSKIGEKMNRPDLIRLGELPVSENDPPLILADNRRLTNEVNWRPDYDLDSGLDKCICWWKDELEGGAKFKNSLE